MPALPDPGRMLDRFRSARANRSTGRKIVLEVESIQRHSTAPAWIKRLGEEYSVAGANDRLLVPRIGDANTWGKAFLPRFFRKIAAETRRSKRVASEC